MRWFVLLLTWSVLIAETVAPAVMQTRAAESLATLDFLVTAGKGATPPSLTPDDLSLKVGGRQQRIRTVEPMKPTTRHIMLIVDEATLYSLEPVVKDAVAKFLASLQPGALVAYHSTGRARTRVTLTTNHKAITEAVDSMVTGPGVLWVCQSDLLRLVQSFATDLPRGRSTTIAVISRGHPEGASAEGDAGGGPCTPRRDDLRKLEEVIALSQINFHLFTVHDTERSWGLDTIAANTGGTSSLLTWSNQDALARAIQASSTFHRLTFDWNAPKELPQRIELRAADRGLKIRTSSVIRPR